MKEKYKIWVNLAIFSLLIFNIIIPFTSFFENSGVRNNAINLRENTIQEEINTATTYPTYLIVTTNAIRSNSANLTNFVNYKKSLNFNVEIITEDNYTSATGKNRILNIRNWLINNYQSKYIQYVLLIGNPDPDDESDVGDSIGDLPMIMCWPRRGASDGYEESPTDYIYADLTGNWDHDSDGYYGEYGTSSQDYTANFNAEVYVGRIPVYSADYTSLDRILWQISKYHSKSGNWKNKIFVPMAISNYEDEDYEWIDRTDGLDVPYYVYNYIANQAGMTDTVMYEHSGIDPVPISAYHYDMELTKTNFINEFNNGHGAVFWWAHGSETGASRKYWNSDDGDNIPESGEMIWIDFISSSDSLQGDQPAFFYQSSCLNGYPEASTNLGYDLLKDGAAISSVCASRVSWYMTGNWDPTLSYADNTGIGYYYMQNLLRYRKSAGESLFSAKAICGSGWGAESWMNKMDFNLYGDPQLYYWGEVYAEQISSESPPPPQSGDDSDSSSSSSSLDPTTLNSGILLIIIIGIIAAGAAVTIIGVVLYTKKSKDKSLKREELSTGFSSTQASISPTVPPKPPIVCTKCGANLQENLSFCTNCGNKLIEKPPAESSIASGIPKGQQSNLPFIFTHSCLKCGSILNAEDLFCTKCGTKINKD